MVQNENNDAALALAMRPDGNFSAILNRLQSDAMQITGQMTWSSNYTFVVSVGEGDNQLTAVYKPQRGERPLWDFPQGTLCHRERAAYLVSAMLGWKIIPPTVLREGEHGLGSVQLFIDHDPELHYFTFENASQFTCQLQQIALLDMLINNADRKGGHVLLQSPSELESGNQLWAIDHGICFHTAYKLRTVIWDYAGQPIPADLLKALTTFQKRFFLNKVDAEIESLLSESEIAAMQERLIRLIEERQFWTPGPGRHYPWPPV